MPPTPTETALEEQDRERLLRWRLRRFREGIDYPDLEQECRIAAWAALAHVRAAALARGVPCRLKASAVMVRAIDWAARDFFRSARSRARTHTRHGGEDPVLVSLSEPGWDHADPEPRTPDFVGAFLERDYARWIWAQRFDCLTEAEIRVLEAALQGVMMKEYAAAVGICRRNAVYRKAQALELYRLHLGLPMVAAPGGPQDARLRRMARLRADKIPKSNRKTAP